MSHLVLLVQPCNKPFSPPNSCFSLFGLLVRWAYEPAFGNVMSVILNFLQLFKRSPPDRSWHGFGASYWHVDITKSHQFSPELTVAFLHPSFPRMLLPLRTRPHNYTPWATSVCLQSAYVCMWEGAHPTREANFHFSST